jgi:hypothetical protein
MQDNYNGSSATQVGNLIGPLMNARWVQGLAGLSWLCRKIASG